jgi:hypothetical protein
MSAKPFLSVVVASRNDDHCGDLLSRLRTSVSGWLGHAARNRMSLELILVEWNPPPDRPRLQDVLDWSRVDTCPVRILSVPHAVHARYPYSDRVGIHGAVALNAGVRRAQGEFVLATTSDVLASDALAAFLAPRHLKKGSFYRIDRSDVSPQVVGVDGLEAQLAFCESHILRVHGRGGHRLPRPRGAPELHLGAPGDFMLLSRQTWHDVRGYPEFDIVGLGLDILLCYIAHLHGDREAVLEPPMRLFHIDHPRMGPPPRAPSRRDRLKSLVPGPLTRLLGAARSRLGARTPTPWDARGVPALGFWEMYDIIGDLVAGRRPLVFNDDGWGLGGESLAESGVASSQRPLSTAPAHVPTKTP